MECDELIESDSEEVIDDFAYLKARAVAFQAT